MTLYYAAASRRLLSLFRRDGDFFLYYATGLRQLY